MAHQRDQGSILGFVLVGAVLTVLLVGGIYVARHRTQATGDIAKTGDSSKSTAGKDTNSSPSSATSGESTSSDSQLKAALDAQSRASAQGSSQSSTSSTAASASNSDTSSSSVSSLPTTGPEQVIVPMLGAAFLAGSMISYVRSRRLI